MKTEAARKKFCPFTDEEYRCGRTACMAWNGDSENGDCGLIPRVSHTELIAHVQGGVDQIIHDVRTAVNEIFMSLPRK